ncbi:MAG: tetratricopeptide repeat protein, partial [Thermoplasmata archaeon]|nr:tetratricopeptide repeat protein [Thermoplasmata archaeon]
MDTDAAFEEVRTLISKGRGPEAIDRVAQIADSDEDPFVRIKCLSLLKVLDESTVSQDILRKLMSSLPEDRNALIQIAGSLRGLDYPSSAYTVLGNLEADDAVRRLSCMCLEDMEEFGMALDTVREIRDPQPFDRVMLSEVLSALGDHKASVEVISALLDEMPDDFDVRRAYVSAMMLAGRDKDAVKYVRACLKDKSAASNALAAYAMRISGNYKAAAGYATRAIKLDQKNVSAMETLGICLADRGEYEKARIVAGAINEASPGSRAALNVLSYCEGHRFSTRCGPWTSWL